MVVRCKRFKRKANNKLYLITSLYGKITNKSSIKKVKSSTRKVRLLIDLIRGMQVDQAIAQLQISNKDAAGPVLKLLKSGIANAQHNHQLKPETLVIKVAYVDGGETLHRWIPRAMGRATPIRKRTSHITLVLEGEVDEKVVAKKAKVKANAPEKKTKEDKVEEIKGESVSAKAVPDKKVEEKK